VAPGESVVNGLVAAKDALYVRKMNGGNSELFRLEYTPNAKQQQVALPFVGDMDGLVSDPRLPGAVFSLGGWIRFGGYFAFQPSLGKVVDTGLQPQGKFDNPGTLVATEVHVKSHDGTLIPMSIVHKKG
jgi:prolyl oligopeptidase